MSQKILVVEDDTFLREMIVKKLKTGGYEVDAAVDGGKAFEKIKEETKDLIILDLMMPEVDGFQFLEKLRADEEKKDIPVIVLSNLGQKEEIDKAKEMGVVDYLVKAQFTPDDITTKVKEVLE